MRIAIITPCTRPQNLFAIKESLQSIPYAYRRWIVIFDLPVEVGMLSNNINALITAEDYYIGKHNLKNGMFLPPEGEYYVYRQGGSTSGNAQRNFALDKIDRGWVYFNDDDTTIHPLLWKRINHLNNDFIHFSQIHKDGSLRLKGNNVKVDHIDSHNFIVSRECIGHTRWQLDKYNADGIFAEDCYRKSVNPIFIPKVLSIYNSLR